MNDEHYINDDNYGSKISCESEIIILEEKTYDVGQFSVFIPAGWKEITFESFDDPASFRTDCVCVCKGGRSLHSDPYVQVNYYGPSITMMSVYKGVYKDVRDVEEFTAGNFTWKVFFASSFGKPFILLQTNAGTNEFQITIWNEQDNGSITLEDDDVQAIINSLTPNQ